MQTANSTERSVCPEMCLPIGSRADAECASDFTRSTIPSLGAAVSALFPFPASCPSIRPSLRRANEIERVYLFIWHLSANLAYGQSDPDIGNDSGREGASHERRLNYGLKKGLIGKLRTIYILHKCLIYYRNLNSNLCILLTLFI